MLTAKVSYDIELDWDYAYLTVNGEPFPTNLSTNTNPNGQNFGNGITGSSAGGWVDLTADLSAFAGQTVTIGFRYWTDGASWARPFVDDIAITGQALDGAETDPGWDYDGFFRSGSVGGRSRSSTPTSPSTATIAVTTMSCGRAYNFGFPNNPTLRHWVEHFPYQDGLLVWYYDDLVPGQQRRRSLPERPLRGFVPAGRRASGPC